MNCEHHRVPRSRALFMALLLSTVATTATAAGRGNAPWVGETLEGIACNGPGVQGYGPWDYRRDRDKLKIVEAYHFNREIEQLRYRRLRDSIAEVRFVLVKGPNHHRALYSAVRFSLMDTDRRLKKKFPAECFLQRAINYVPDDPVPYQLFGLYLHRLDQMEEALKFYRRAESLAPNDPMLQYNIGLLLTDMHKYDEALSRAEAAYGAGVTLPGLRDQLAAQGYTVSNSTQ